MSLGSIAHMQHYFARTGLLDGRGAQLEKKQKRDRLSNGHDSVGIVDLENDYLVEDEQRFGNTDMAPEGNVDGYDEQVFNSGRGSDMLPPTVSTYKYKPADLQPLPELSVLRRELYESLGDAQAVMKESTEQHTSDSHSEKDVEKDLDQSTQDSENQGWYELQGLHILDIVTLAIRAAKHYYTCHSNPQRLYAIKSEREIRSELYQVLDNLKRAANRNFRGGIREAEQQGILDWISGIFDLLAQEEALERQEEALRTQWSWLQGDWQGRDRPRELLFLRSFDEDAELAPEWTAPLANAHEPSQFLMSLQNGLLLVKLHNRLVERSKRRFGQIETFHTDVAKPYRCADNLRYWIKAADLRWEVKLELNALDVVQGKEPAIWAIFDAAVLKWSKAVREELTIEWLNGEGNTSLNVPPISVGADS